MEMETQKPKMGWISCLEIIPSGGGALWLLERAGSLGQLL